MTPMRKALEWTLVPAAVFIIVAFPAGPVRADEIPAAAVSGNATLERDLAEIRSIVFQEGSAAKLAEAGLTPAEVMSREIWQRMRQSQFKLSRYAKNFQEEMADMNRQDFSGNRDNYPLVGALRYAVHKINFAKAQEARKPQKNYPSKAIV